MSEEKKQEGKMDFEAMMEVYRKLSVPGAPHKALASRAGSWETRNRHWMEPENPPMESTGACERKMILDGRYLQEELTGEIMGSPFRGISFTGYDNHTGKYVTVWMDTMSTGIYTFEGAAGDDGKTFTFESSYDDPVKGPVKLRGVTRLIDDNTEAFEMIATDKEGKEERCETVYTRKQ